MAFDGVGMHPHFQCAIQHTIAVGASRMGNQMHIDVAIPIGLPMQKRPGLRSVHAQVLGAMKKPDAVEHRA